LGEGERVSHPANSETTTLLGERHDDVGRLAADELDRAVRRFMPLRPAREVRVEKRDQLLVRSGASIRRREDLGSSACRCRHSQRSSVV
jgi:hypothetical protein